MRKSLRIALVLLGLVIGASLAGCKNSNDLQDPPGFIPPCEVSVLHGLDPVWMFQNGWELPCPDHDNDSILNECDVDLTLGEDCNLNGIDDSCEQDTDLDNIIDDCDDDIDGDLIPNECDIDETMGLDCDEDGQDDSCELDTDSDLIIDDCDDDDDNDGDSDDDEIDCGSDPLDANDMCPVGLGCRLTMLGKDDVSKKSRHDFLGTNDLVFELKGFKFDNRGFYTPTKLYVKVNSPGFGVVKFTINWNQIGRLYLGRIDLDSMSGSDTALMQYFVDEINGTYFCFNNDCVFRYADGNQANNFQLNWGN